MKNKRADIPVTILVLGVIAVCGLAVLSFIVSEKITVKPDKLGVEIFEKLYSGTDKFEFYKNVGISPEEAAANSGFKLGNDGKLIVENYNSGGQIVIKKYSPE
jgi:hypothetical protein